MPATAAPFIRKEKFFQQLLSILLSQNDIKLAGMGPNSPARIVVFKIYILIRSKYKLGCHSHVQPFLSFYAIFVLILLESF